MPERWSQCPSYFLSVPVQVHSPSVHDRETRDCAADLHQAEHPACASQRPSAAPESESSAPVLAPNPRDSATPDAQARYRSRAAPPVPQPRAHVVPDCRNLVAALRLRHASVADRHHHGRAPRGHHPAGHNPARALDLCRGRDDHPDRDRGDDNVANTDRAGGNPTDTSKCYCRTRCRTRKRRTPDATSSGAG